jgi:hypothetical protein
MPDAAARSSMASKTAESAAKRCSCGILHRAVLTVCIAGENRRHRRTRFGERTKGAGPRPQWWYPGVRQRGTPPDWNVVTLDYEFLDQTRLTDARRSADQNEPARARSCSASRCLRNANSSPRPTS